MKRYFIAVQKRFLKISPFVFAVAAVLFSCIVFAMIAVSSFMKNDEKRATFKVGITGDLDHRYFDLALDAMKVVDVSRFILEVYEMSEDEAKAAVEKGELSSYIVIPEGFIKALGHGEIPTVKYVSSSADNTMGAYLKNGVTEVVERVVFSAMKGVFAAEGTLWDDGFKKRSSHVSSEMNIEYIDLFLSRSELYTAVNLGVFSEVTFSEKLLSGLLSVFLFISSGAFALVLVRRDNAMSRVLSAGGIGPARQVFCEFSSFLLMFFVIQLPICAFSIWFISPEKFSAFSVVYILLNLFISVAFSFFVFELCDNVASAVLLQFFSSIALSYVSGCFYPINSLPDVFQKMSRFSPTGIVRENFEATFSNTGTSEMLLKTAVYTLLLLAAVYAVRRVKIAKNPEEQEMKQFYLFTKRVLKKPSFIVLLVLIPLFVFSISKTSGDEKGLVRIALVYDSNEGMARELAESLDDGNNLIGYERLHDRDKALSLLLRGLVDAVWVFPSDMETRLLEFLESKSSSDALFEIIEREETVINNLVRERVTGELYVMIADDVYLNYIRKNVPELDSYTDEELLFRYNDFEEANSFFDYNTLASEEKESTGYMLAPMRGVLCLFVLLGALMGAVQYRVDLSHGFFANYTPTRKLFAEFFSVTVFVLPLVFVSLVSLALAGAWRDTASELFSGAAFLLTSTLYAILISSLLNSMNLLAVITPVLVFVEAVVCPVFFELRVFRGVRHTLPSAYYFKVLESPSGLLFALLYICAVSGLILILKKIKKQGC